MLKDARQKIAGKEKEAQVLEEEHAASRHTLVA
jgi:hypothetical protein